MMVLMAFTPRRLGVALGHYLGRHWYADKHSKKYRNTRANIDLCFPEMSEAARDALCRESLIHTGFTTAEMSAVWLRSVDWSLQQIQSIKGEDAIREELTAGRGILMIAPHLGNWEVMNLYLAHHYPVTAMYKRPRVAMVDRLVKKMRARLGSKMAPADASGIRMVLKALKHAEVVGILPDQEPPKGNGGVFVPFFGTDAWTMKLLPQLAAKSRCKVFCGYAMRLPNNQGYELRFSPVDESISSRDVKVSATTMNAAIERCVREAPEQYQWEYRRFETTPEGESDRYSKYRKNKIAD